MLGVGLLVSAVNVVLKRIGLLSALFLWALKILSGYFFPVEALDDFIPGLSSLALSLPTSAGLEMIRWVLIVGAPPSEMLWTTLTSLLIGTTITMTTAIITLKYMEKIAAKFGTLEFY
jgi:ABC-type polysaccharide/polyol phosphate export permease